MGVWVTTLGLQALIALAMLLVGKLVFRLNTRSCILATLLMTPVPLFQVTPGAAGFIYTADLIAVGMLLRQMVRPEPIDPHIRARLKPMLILAFMVTVGLPLLSTLAGYAVDPARDYKAVLLGLGRGLGYWVIFRAFTYLALRESRPHVMLILQVLGFTCISLCGLLQYRSGINLDLWNEVRGLDPSRYIAGGYGGGYMGMYRGAAGAWAAGILAVAPIVLGQSLWSFLLLPGVFAMVMGGVLTTGSRQGFFIGFLAFILGAFGAALGMPSGRRAGAFVRSVAGVFLVMFLGGMLWQSYTSDSLKGWFERRFENLLDPEEFLYQAASRDIRREEVYNHITSKPQVFVLGTGHGSIVESANEGGLLSRIYIDSEFFFVWQLGGTVLLAAYAWFLLRLRLRWRKRLLPHDLSPRLTVTSATVALYTGVLLIYGHFFLMTTDASQAPVAYWNWSLFGLAFGVGTQAIVNRSMPNPR